MQARQSHTPKGGGKARLRHDSAGLLQLGQGSAGWAAAEGPEAEKNSSEEASGHKRDARCL